MSSNGTAGTHAAAGVDGVKDGVLPDGVRNERGRGIRVAIIDSGVHAQHPHVGGVAGGVAIDPEGHISDDFVDRLGHGTAVAGAIREKAAAAELYAVRVFDRTLKTHVTSLVVAIEWAVRQQVHVINLSLGTANPAHEARLADAVARAQAAGVVVVAARDDGGTRWLPGCLPGVLSVRADAACRRDTFQRDPVADAVIFRTSPYPRPIPGLPPERNLNGVSFAVANMSGFVAAALDACRTGHTLAEAVIALDALRPGVCRAVDADPRASVSAIVAELE